MLFILSRLCFMGLILKFEEIGKDDVSIAGGKGASLGEMTQAGIPVPSGFIIAASAFDQFLLATDINVEIDAALVEVNIGAMHTIEDASEVIRSLIVNATMPESIVSEIEQAFSELEFDLVAVRSSATAEDGVSEAWAGQLDTFLNTTHQDLIENVQKCWASLFTPRAIFYRFEQGLDTTDISVAVVIQKMVQSEVSGVAFSVHPVTQDRNQLIIEAGWGLGEAIVSGSITPDSYVLTKDNWQILDVNVSEQEKMVGHGGWTEVSIEKRGAQKLTSEQIIELGKLVAKIEVHYGFPVDVEWALEDGVFYITQSRPITTLSA